MKPVLDKIAIWTPIPDKGVFSKTFIGRLEYQDKNGVLGQASVSRPIYSYAKNYAKFKLDFSLFVYTDNSDTEDVVKALDEAAKKIKKKEIDNVVGTAGYGNFRYLEDK